mmetsp:Transcript_7162/g.29615  ORF Transcript_7162/g.29615 Transcript_7162/m.29615 type:complete len:223 (+) Transcript_7162:4548-5216(+)
MDATGIYQRDVHEALEHEQPLFRSVYGRLPAATPQSTQLRSAGPCQSLRQSTERVVVELCGRFEQLLLRDVKHRDRGVHINTDGGRLGRQHPPQRTQRLEHHDPTVAQAIDESVRHIEERSKRLEVLRGENHAQSRIHLGLDAHARWTHESPHGRRHHAPHGTDRAQAHANHAPDNRSAGRFPPALVTIGGDVPQQRRRSCRSVLRVVVSVLNVYDGRNNNF